MANYLVKSLLTMFPAKFLARPVDDTTPPAKLEAWLNLSHRENARVFVMVRINAMAECVCQSQNPRFNFVTGAVLTNQAEPNEMHKNNRYHCQGYPQNWLNI